MILAPPAVLGSGAPRLQAQQRTAAVEVRGEHVRAFCSVNRWLTQQKSFKSEQRRIENYRLRVEDDSDQRLVVHLIPSLMAEDIGLAGGETPRGRECRVTLTKSAMAVERVEYYE